MLGSLPSQTPYLVEERAPSIFALESNTVIMTWHSPELIQASIKLHCGESALGTFGHGAIFDLSPL
jgi:hypothetical protein